MAKLETAIENVQSKAPIVISPEENSRGIRTKTKTHESAKARANALNLLSATIVFDSSFPSILVDESKKMIRIIHATTIQISTLNVFHGADSSNPLSTYAIGRENIRTGIES